MKTNILIQIFIVLIVIHTQSVSCDQSNYKPYNSLAKFIVNTQQYGKILIDTQTHQNSRYNGILFLVFQDERLVLLDYNNSMKQLVSYEDQIHQLSIRDNFIYMNSKGTALKILRFEDNKMLNQVNQWSPPPNYDQDIDQFLVSNDEKTIFIGCGSHLVIIDIQNKLQPAVKKIDLINPVFGKFPSLSYSTVWITQVGQFLFLSNQKGHLNVLQIAQDYSSFTFITQLSKFGSYSIQTLFVKSAGIFISLSRFYGVFIFDVSSLLMPKPDIDGFLQYIQTGSPTVVTYTATIQDFLLSPDEKFIFVAVRSVGVLVYDISQDPYKPQQAQRLLSDGVAFQINFFKGSVATLLLSDGNQLKIYQEVTQRQNSVYIKYNMFNTNSCVATKPFENEKWPWFIVNSKDDNYLAVSGGVYGLNIYDISGDNINNPILVFQQNLSTSNNDKIYALLYLDQRDLLIVGQNKKGTVIYDVKDFSNPIYKAQYQSDSVINDHSDYQTNQDQTLLAIASFSSVFILDISNVSDSTKLKLVMRYDLPDSNGAQRKINSISFNSLFTYGFYVIREYGVFAFRIIKNQSGQSMSLQLQMLQSFYSLGAQYVQYDLNQKYVFFSNGINGVSFIDVRDPEQPKIINTVSIDGWAVKTYQPLLNQDILFVNQMERGQLTLLDISDRTNPVKVSELQFNSESSFSTVTNRLSERYYFAFTVEQGFRICINYQPIQLLFSSYSNNIDGSIFNPQSDESGLEWTQDQLNGNTEALKSNLNINDIYIQDNVLINLSPFYYQNHLRFLEINYYKDFQVTTTPSWITYSAQDLSISMIPSYKDLPDNQDTITLLLTIQTQLQPEQLTSQYVSLQSAQSLINGLRDKGVLDENNFLVSSDEGIYYSIPIAYSLFGTLAQYKLILQQIIFSLKQVQFIFPITLKILPSLVINSDLNNTEQPFVQTFSDNIAVNIEFSLTDEWQKMDSEEKLFPVQFVQINYSEMIVTYTRNNLMNIKAEKNILNQNIRNGFLYGIKQNSSVPSSYMQATFSVSDDVNKLNNVTFPIDNCPYLIKLKPLSLSASTSLRSQYRSQYPNDLTVEESFTIQFTTNIFVNPSQQQLLFTAFIQEDKENIQIQQNDTLWINFDPINLTLKGRKSLKDLFKSFTIIIQATDSYSQINDTLTISFTQLSIPMIVMFSFVGFIVFFILLGVYLCRNQIHKYWNYYDISYCELVIHAKTTSKKSIVLAPYTQINLDILRNELIKEQKKVLKNANEFKKVSISKIKESLVEKYSDPVTKDILLQILIEDANRIYQRSPIIFNNLIGSELRQSDSRISLALFCLISNWALEGDKEALKVFQNLREYAQNKTHTSDWYLYYLSVSEPKQIDAGGSNSRTTGSSDQEYPPLYQNLEIYEDNFDQVIEIIKENRRKSQKEVGIKMKIIENAIKSEYYGFKENIKTSNSKVNFGQTMHLRMNQVSSVLVKEKEEEKTIKESIINHIPCIRYLREKLLMDFKKIALKSANKQNTNLPKWMSYEICDHNLIFTLKPQQKDIGEFLVEIYNHNKYTFYIFKIFVRGSHKQALQLDKAPKSTFNGFASTNQNLIIHPLNQENLEKEEKIQVLFTQQINQSLQESPTSQNLQTHQKSSIKSSQNIQMQSFKTSNNIFLHQGNFSFLLFKRNNQNQSSFHQPFFGSVILIQTIF